ncbi:hypothetical protein BS50DRAFT_287860 [Corynespora cassiicola Philippines]|uniref:Uncharacterized protein n=1 Tax=Corynespora cassiicola Philippines TaxID=1448308 RepID=A0A2T2N0V9_CORCC|nr:hypothetical protein BS50DRAFT_287860 [Corynespora cassiicola Philippines]
MHDCCCCCLKGDLLPARKRTSGAHTDGVCCWSGADPQECAFLACATPIGSSISDINFVHAQPWLPGCPRITPLSTFLSRCCVIETQGGQSSVWPLPFRRNGKLEQNSKSWLVLPCLLGGLVSWDIGARINTSLQGWRLVVPDHTSLSEPSATFRPAQSRERGIQPSSGTPVRDIAT